MHLSEKIIVRHERHNSAVRVLLLICPYLCLARQVFPLKITLWRFSFRLHLKVETQEKEPHVSVDVICSAYKIETKPNEQTLEVLERQEICTHSSWESHAYCMHERWTLRPCAALRQNFVNFIAFRQRLCHKSQWGFLRFCWLPFAVQPEAKSNTLRSPCVQVQSFSH